MTNCICIGYNLAISLPLSYFVCIDVDRHDKDGLIAYNKLVKNLGEIDTYTELTPTNGGLHIFVKADGILDNVRNCDLAEGVEFKKNGYVVCAPSYFKGNNYKIPEGITPEDLNLQACMDLIKLQSDPDRPKARRGKTARKKA